MEATLQALGELLVKAIPTFLLVIALHFYLKKVFFGPMGRLLEERRQATEGARQRAEQLLAQAAEKAVQYEQALRAARAEMYREQEVARQRWLQQHAEAVREAREQAQAAVRRAQQELEAELEQARAILELRSQQLGNLIAESILRGRAA